MQRIFSAVWQLLGKQILILVLTSSISLGWSFALATQPSYAQIPLDSKATGLSPDELTGKPKDTPLTPEEKIDRAYMFREGVGLREEDRQAEYQKAAEVAKEELEGVEKQYEENLKEYRKLVPPNENLVEQAQDLVKKATGNE